MLGFLTYSLMGSRQCTEHPRQSTRLNTLSASQKQAAGWAQDPRSDRRHRRSIGGGVSEPAAQPQLSRRQQRSWINRGSIANQSAQLLVEFQVKIPNKELLRRFAKIGTGPVYILLIDLYSGRMPCLSDGLNVLAPSTDGRGVKTLHSVYCTTCSIQPLLHVTSSQLRDSTPFTRHTCSIIGHACHVVLSEARLVLYFSACAQQTYPAV